jgi:hypothetical protein
MTQYNPKRGLQIFGNDGIKAIQEELKQLHDRNVLTPVNGRTLGTQERQGALPYLMFLKQRNPGRLKAEGVLMASDRSYTVTRKMQVRQRCL